MAAKVEDLLENPYEGDSLGNNCYKVRLAITSKGKGKSGGARVITCVQIQNDVLYLLSIYDKTDKDDLADGELSNLLKQII